MGSAQCIWYAPHTFDQDDDTVAIVINQHGDPEEDIQTAVASCPADKVTATGRAPGDGRGTR
jgi:ferredoxin